MQEMVGCRMESQRRRHQINEGRSLLQNDPWEIAVAGDLSALQQPANAQPIIGSLQRQVNVLAGFQFNDRQPASTRHSEKVKNAVFASRIGKNLRVDESLVEHGIHARYVFANNGFEPALRLSAVERMAEHLQLMQKMLQSGARSGSEFLASVSASKKNAATVPTRERQTAKTHPNFPGLRRGMQCHRLWRHGHDGI